MRLLPSRKRRRERPGWWAIGAWSSIRIGENGRLHSRRLGSLLRMRRLVLGEEARRGGGVDNVGGVGSVAGTSCDFLLLRLSGKA